MKRNWHVSGSSTLRKQVYTLMIRSAVDNAILRINSLGSLFKDAVLSPHKG